MAAPKGPPQPPEDDLNRKAAQAYREALKLRAAAARTDPCMFAQHVMRDEDSGAEVKLAPMHRLWLEAAEKYKRLLIFASPGGGKSALLSVVYSVFCLGRNPNERIVILSAAEKQAKRIIRGIKQYIEGSPALREVVDDRTFHRLEPGDQWDQTAITVERSISSRDPSVQVFGKGGAIQGARPDRIIIDDLLTRVNSNTPEMRDEMEGWFNALIMSRVGPKTRLVGVGNVIQSDDLFHRWVRRGGWHVIRSPLLDARGRLTWPEKFSMEALEEKKVELGPIEFKRQILCEDTGESAAYFEPEMFDGCLKRGNGVDLWRRLESLPRDSFTVTGVDLAQTQGRFSDRTVLFTILVEPDGTRRLLMIESGKWNGTEIIHKIVDTHVRYKSIVVVEENSAQLFIDCCGKIVPDIPIIPHSTQGSNKSHQFFGIEGMAHEFRSNRWIIPNRDGVVAETVASWLQGFLDYQPLTHTSDFVMASWVAREYARQQGVRMGGAAVTVRAIGAGAARTTAEDLVHPFDRPPEGRMPPSML